MPLVNYEKVQLESQITDLRSHLNRYFPEEPSVVNLVLDSYDLQSFLGSWDGGVVKLDRHFEQHVQNVIDALRNY